MLNFNISFLRELILTAKEFKKFNSR